MLPVATISKSFISLRCNKFALHFIFKLFNTKLNFGFTSLTTFYKISDYKDVLIQGSCLFILGMLIPAFWQTSFQLFKTDFKPTFLGYYLFVKKHRKGMPNNFKR